MVYDTASIAVIMLNLATLTDDELHPLNLALNAGWDMTKRNGYDKIAALVDSLPADHRVPLLREAFHHEVMRRVEPTAQPPAERDGGA